MKRLLYLLVLIILCSSTALAHGRLSHPPMTNVPNPTYPNGLPSAGRYQVCPPSQNYPIYVPLYPPLVQPREAIKVEIVTAEGLNLSDGRYRRVQFYIGVCANGQIWCQAGVTAWRFWTEDEAYRFVERMSYLRDFSLREISRRANSTLWYIN